MRRVADLIEAAGCLEDEAQVVQLAAHALLEACPRGLAYVFTTRGRPARTIGSIGAAREGARMRLDGYERYYPIATQAYNRAAVQVDQRDRWIEPLHGVSRPEIYRRNPLYRHCMRPHGVFEHGRMVVCSESRMLGMLAVSLPHGDSFLDDERRHLESCAQSLSGPVRVASLIAVGSAAADGLDHLMASRSDAAYMLSPTGQLLAASVAGDARLRERPELREYLQGVVRQAGGACSTAIVPDLGIEIHAAPCSPRGSASAYLLSLTETATGEDRGRMTPRQVELLAYLREGLTNREIAKAMGLSPATVKTMLERLYRRAGVSGRVALLRWADPTGE